MTLITEEGGGVGERLRRRRKALQLSLKEASAAAGITEGYLSQVEREQANASVATLQRLCAVLKLNVGDLFAPQASSDSRVTRFRDATKLSFGDRATKLKITPPGFDHLELLLGHLEAGGSTGVAGYTHGDSEEVLVVLSGNVTVFLGEERFELGAMDSINYRSSQPHRLEEASGEHAASVLWAMSPPTY